MHRSVLIALLLTAHVAAQEAPDRAITAVGIGKHLARLASDEFEGRGPGVTKGAALARDYIIGALEAAGARPGYHDEWIQPVPLRRIRNSTPTLTLGSADHEDWSLTPGVDFVAENRNATGRYTLEGELVFVGYGCQAPEYGWDDLKGLDCRGKILVMLVGDPPTEDGSLFGGEAMTYYGRWSYKFEKANELGAAGCLVVHRAKAAGYPWFVVANGWNGQAMDIPLEDGEKRLTFEGWLSWDATAKLMERAGHDLDALCEAARKPDFRPVPLGVNAHGRISTSSTPVDDENIVGIMPGSDPHLKREWVIYTAHFDHLGRGRGVGGPDQDDIFNGAVDNASGCAAVLSIAEAFGRLKGSHRRSVMFLFVCSEEQGLLGSRYYCRNPIVPVARTVANVNIDGLNVHEATTDVQVIGWGQSTLDGILAAEIAQDDRHTAPDSESEKGYYYRSDHFNFARVGIPAIYIKAGDVVPGKPADYMPNLKLAYTGDRYHKPSDEYDPAWPITGGEADARALFRVGLRVLNQDSWPEWSATSEFKAVRDAALGR